MNVQTRLQAGFPSFALSSKWTQATALIYPTRKGAQKHVDQSQGRILVWNGVITTPAQKLLVESTWASLLLWLELYSGDVTVQISS